MWEDLYAYPCKLFNIHGLSGNWDARATHFRRSIVPEFHRSAGLAGGLRVIRTGSMRDVKYGKIARWNWWRRPLYGLLGSVFQRSMPAAWVGTSRVATVVSEARSITSTVPGSEPMPSTEMNA
jgi:hypothetical protein